jgi:hypothetical protein
VRTLDRKHDRPRATDADAGVDVDVTLVRAIGCMRCGMETSGRATCAACLQALDELRGLATDPRSLHDSGFWLSDRVSDLR